MVEMGLKVLVCDLDPQSNLTIGLGVDPTTLLDRNMKELLANSKTRAEDFLLQTAEGIDLFPSGIELSRLEAAAQEVAREKMLAKKLQPLLSNYDFILCDTPPSLGHPTLNAMAAADYILIPVEPQPFCIYGLSQLQETFEMIREDSNLRLAILGLFIAKLDKRISLQNEIAERVKNEWGDLAFQTIIYSRAKIQETQLEGRSIITSDKNSPTAKEYRALTKEVLHRAK